MAAGLQVLQEVSTSLVDENPFNARSVYDAAVVGRLASEILADGQLVAAVAVVSSATPGRYTLIDGHYRLRALNAVGSRTILLDVRGPLPNVELFRLSFKLNEHRAAHTAVDNALAWSRLLGSGTVASQKELRVLTGKSMGTISKTLQILELPTDVLEIVTSHPARFTLKLSYALAQICRAAAAEDARRLASRAINEEVAGADIEKAIVKARLGKRARKQRNSSEAFHVRGAACVGTIKRWASGRVSVDLSFAEPSSTLEFVHQLRRLVSADQG